MVSKTLAENIVKFYVIFYIYICICICLYLFDFIDFVFPREGTFITLESCAIPVASTREHLTYEFMNFIYQPNVLIQNGNSCYVFLPDKRLLKHPKVLPQIKKITDKLEKDKVPLLFFEHLISPIQFRTTWVEIKSYKL